MTTANMPDYHLTGTQRSRAEALGLTNATWYQCDIDRKTLKKLMKRTDRHALVHVGSWLILLLLAGVAAGWSWGSAWAVPLFLVYGVLYSASDHWAHELAHGTPFRTRWLNNLFYQLASFMTTHEPVYWRWGHARHHTDTLITGSDREIAVQRPPNLLKMGLDFFHIPFTADELGKQVRHALGSVSAETRDFVPENEIPRMVRNCRFYMIIYLVVIALAMGMGSWLPLMFVITPRIYAGFLAQTFNLTQHAGLPENVLDHRKNCRTVYMNPVFRFLYVNMNYHVEHHMFPMVPYYRLPELHEHIKNQCAPATPGVIAAYREFIPVVLRQRNEPDFCLQRELP